MRHFSCVGQKSGSSSRCRQFLFIKSSSFVFRNCDHAAARFDLSDAGNIYELTNPLRMFLRNRWQPLEEERQLLQYFKGSSYFLFHSGEMWRRTVVIIVAAKNIYGGTFNLLLHTLPQYGITTTFVDIFNDGELEAAIQDNTKAVFIETLGNPNSDVVDIEAVAEIAHKHKIPLIVDNTFATPYLVRPIEYGADIVVHSATKFIGGHGTAVGGVIVDGGKFDWEASGKFPVLTEPDPSYHGINLSNSPSSSARK